MRWKMAAFAKKAPNWVKGLKITQTSDNHFLLDVYIPHLETWYYENKHDIYNGHVYIDMCKSKTKNCWYSKRNYFYDDNPPKYN